MKTYQEEALKDARACFQTAVQDHDFYALCDTVERLMDLVEEILNDSADDSD